MPNYNNRLYLTAYLLCLCAAPAIAVEAPQTAVEDVNTHDTTTAVSTVEMRSQPEQVEVSDAPMQDLNNVEDETYLAHEAEEPELGDVSIPPEVLDTTESNPLDTQETTAQIPATAAHASNEPSADPTTPLAPADESPTQDTAIDKVQIFPSSVTGQEHPDVDTFSEASAIGTVEEPWPDTATGAAEENLLFGHVSETPPEPKEKDAAPAITQTDCAKPKETSPALDAATLARAAMESGNYAEAYYYWRPAAEEGNIEAQYGLGWMYHNGYGLAIDDEQALSWWEKAAVNGHPDALFSIAMLYNMGGSSIPRNMDIAVAYYVQAAHYGHEDAKLVLRGLLGQGDKAVLNILETILVDDWQLLGQPMKVRVRRANTRTEPHNQAPIITTLEEGHELIELSRKGEWVKVGITGLGRIGWIYTTLIVPLVDAPPVTDANTTGDI